MSDPTEREATAKALRVFLLGIEDVFVKAGLATALRQANVPQYISHYPLPTMAPRALGDEVCRFRAIYSRRAHEQKWRTDE